MTSPVTQRGTLMSSQFPSKNQSVHLYLPTACTFDTEIVNCVTNSNFCVINDQNCKA